MPSFDELILEGLTLPFSGWDFSILGGRWNSREPSWDYRALARSRMHGITSMLDQDTGGGELLSSLTPLPQRTWASESYPPNIPVAKVRLEPLNVQVITDYSDDAFPLPDSSLGLILNRHGSYSERELLRLMKPGAIFLTEQVGGENDIRLNELLQEKVEFQYSYWTKERITHQLIASGFELITIREEFPLAEFADVGAVVFYLRIIPWQIANFDVNKYRNRLNALHQEIISKGPLQVHDHRILVEARKPSQE